MTVDGVRVKIELEHRASRTVWIVGARSRAAGLDLHPYAPQLVEKIARLSDAEKQELYSRGILRFADDKLYPAWTLKTTFHWMQTFARGVPTTVALSYRPVVGKPAPGALRPGLDSMVCLKPEHTKKIQSIRAQGSVPKMTLVSYQATLGAAWLDAIGQFLLTIDKPSQSTMVATCRTGLKPAGPTQLEWGQRDHSVEDDYFVLFID